MTNKLWGGTLSDCSPVTAQQSLVNEYNEDTAQRNLKTHSDHNKSNLLSWKRMKEQLQEFMALVAPSYTEGNVETSSTERVSPHTEEQNN